MARKARAQAQEMAQDVVQGEVIELSNGIRVPVEPVQETPKAPKPTAEEKAAAMLEEAAKDKILAAAERAAERLNKPNRKTLADWRAVGAAMIRIDELVKGNKKLIGKIVETLPQFSSIPSPIRSNAKWLEANWSDVEPMIEDGRIVGDHPTTIREKFNAIRKQLAHNNPPADGEGEGGEGNGNGGSDTENDDAVNEALAKLDAFVKGASREALDSFVMRLGSLLAEKAGSRKALMSQLPS